MNSKLRNDVLRVAIALSLGAFAVNGFAGTDSTTFSVTADITDTCEVTSTNLTFGDYLPLTTHSSATLQGTATISLTCTEAAVPLVDLNQGANFDTGRQMVHSVTGTEYLDYTLYSGGVETTEWVSGTPVTGPTGDYTANDMTVYGSITAGQEQETGSYSDTITVTVSF